MVHDVVDELDMHGFIIYPRLHHVLKACALPCNVATRTAIVNLVLRNHNVGRAACVTCVVSHVLTRLCTVVQVY